MAAEKKFPLSIIVRAIDKISGPMRSITGKLNALTKPFRQFGKDVGKFSDAIGFPTLIKGFQGFGGAIKNVGAEAFSLGAKFLTVAGAAAFAAFAIVRNFVDAGDELAMFADRAKVTVDWFASMRFAAEQNDVEQEQFNEGIAKFVKNLGDMKAGGGQLLTFLNKVAPKLAEQVKGAKSTEAAYSIMTDAFGRITDSGKLAALGAAAFGRSAGPAMANFLHTGSAAIQKQQIEFLRLQGSQEAYARASSDLDNALRETKTAFLGLGTTAAGQLFPALTLLSQTVTEFIVKNRDGIKRWADGAAASITAWVQSGGFERLVASIQQVTSSVLKFVDDVGGFKTVAIAIAAVVAGPLLGAIAALIPAVVSLGVALLTTPIGWFLIGVAALAGAAALVIKNWEPIKAFFVSLWEDGIVGPYKRMWAWLQPKLETMGHVLRQIFDPFGTFGTTQDTDPRFLPENDPGRNRSLGAAGVAASSTTKTESRVQVDFSNAPPGTRVTQDKNSSQPVDMSVGYSSAAL